MAVQRISDIDVAKRGLFTAIYGNVTEGEFFIDKDLKKYNLWQQLYVFLKKEGYMVLFYDTANNVHSYSQADLAEFLRLGNSSPVQAKKYVATHINSPFRQNRISAAEKKAGNSMPDDPVHLSIQQAKIVGRESTFYRTTRTAGMLDDLKQLFSDPTKKIAYIIKEPENWTDSNGNYTILFNALEADHVRIQHEGRIFLIYNYDNAYSLIEGFERKTSFFYTDSFRTRFIDSSDSNHLKLKLASTYYLPVPDKEEIRNMINRKRLTSNVNVFYPVPLDKIVARLAQERKQLKVLNWYDLNDYINRIDNLNAWDKLKSLKGIDSIIKTLEQKVRAIRNNPNGRPHMVFKGPPGTGKTIIARLFAEILREEGVLEIGHLVETTVGDLVSEYIGGTRIKTQKKCDEAKGGILFIDEAYGLLNKRDDGVDFGKEAIEILIQFMENSKDSLVIIAGYPNQIDQLLRDGNPGFRSRFRSANHIIFKDYEPDTLIEIAKARLKAKNVIVTPDAERIINNIIRKQYDHRPPDWGNGRAIENLIDDIVEAGDGRNIDIQHIPDHYQRMINPPSISDGLSKLDSLIGLSKMKNTLRSILEVMQFEKERAEIMKIQNGYKPDLTFVFTGNPGTGKTTVARLLGEILCEFGLLSTSEVIECHRNDLVAGYTGQTAIKANDVFEKALGKVLFIDEAYSLVEGDNDSFGKEAVTKIVEVLTDPNYVGNFAFVIAGYPEKIKEFLQTNAGLTSRFTHYIQFEDYTNEELWQIYKLMASNNLYKLSNEEQCKTNAMQWLKAQTQSIGLANARLIEKVLFPTTKQKLLKRLKDISDKTVDMVTTIIPDDFPVVSGVINTTGFTNPTKASPLSINLYKSQSNETANINELIKQSIGIVSTEHGAGTGFLISVDGYILTAYHVISKNQRFQFGLCGNAVNFKAELVWTNEQIDMALLKVDLIKQIFTPLELISYDEPETEQLAEIYLAGYPLGATLALTPTITEDKIANCQQQVSVNATMRFNAIYTYNNATNGYSGGPLIRKSDLKVIGVLHGGLPDNGNINLSSDIKQLYVQEELKLNTIIH